LAAAAAAAVWDRKLVATALHATVPRTASPIEPPTCWPTLTRLEFVFKNLFLAERPVVPVTRNGSAVR
jgi:hypothetical protein